MKQSRFILLSILLLLSSCSEKEVKIEGTIEGGDYNGKTIYLFYPSPTAGYDTFEELSRANIEEGKFVFDITLDEVFEKEIPMMGYLTMFDMSANFDEENRAMSETPIATFILEKGNIRVGLHGNSVVLSGTPRNEEFNDIHAAIKKLVDFADQIEGYPNIIEVPLDDEGRDGRAQFQQYNDRLAELTYDFTKKNMKNNVGQFLFLKSYTDNLFTPAQLTSLIEEASEKFREREDVSWLMGVLDQMNSVDDSDTNLDIENEVKENDLNQ